MGAVAQLGERLLCKQEVTGSIPVSSTTSTKWLRVATESNLPESKENKQNNLLETGSHASDLEF